MTELRKEVRRAVQILRLQIVWKHIDGEAHRTGPQYTEPKEDEDRVYIWKKVWDHEMMKYQEEDAEELRRHQEIGAAEHERMQKGREEKGRQLAEQQRRREEWLEEDRRQQEERHRLWEERRETYRQGQILAQRQESVSSLRESWRTWISGCPMEEQGMGDVRESLETV
jgi:hypothetical protein